MRIIIVYDYSHKEVIMPSAKKKLEPFRYLHPELATAVEDLLEARKSLDNLTASLAVLVQNIRDELSVDIERKRENKYLTIDGVAKKTGLKPKTIYNFVCRNAIPYCKIGGSVRFIESDIDAWARREGNYGGEGV